MLTNEEAKGILQSLKFIVDDYSDDVEEALNMAIKALEQTAWIPVGERLPEIGKKVLVYVMGDKALLCFHEVRDSYIGIYMGDGRWGAWIYDGMRLLDSEDVLAWTPLPKPYKKGR